ncbi:MAG: ABC transporter ATP-binding protein [Chloroflexota bacterium]
MRRCYGYLRNIWHLTIFTYITSFAMIGLALVIPQFIRWIVDHGIREQNLTLLGQSVLALLGLTLLRGLLGFAQGRWSEKVSQQVTYLLRNEVHQKLTELSFAYHDRVENGQLLTRVMQDAERIRFLVGRATLRILDSTFLFIGTGIVLFLMNPTLSLLVMATIPLLFHRGYKLARVYRPLSLEIQNQLAVVTTHLEQNLRGARVVKAFAQEDEETHRFDAENEAWFDLAALSARVIAFNAPLMDFIANLGTVFIIWYGGAAVIRGELSLGELVAFTTYLAQLVMPVRRLGLIIPAMAMGISAGERLFDILDTKSDIVDAPDAKPLPEIQGHVRFEDVSFAYDLQYANKDNVPNSTEPDPKEPHPKESRATQHIALEHITLEAKPGEVIALLGATGSGKSSVINLIPRFYDPSSGRVTVDGYDLSQVTQSSLRSQIGMVLQETTLFATTIRENIAFGYPNATQAEIESAARAAQAHDFISAMPNGYETDVGERGSTLSGGQKQRIAIARALLKDPRILILDDATASVDNETERLIQMALERLMAGRTSFVVAQRLSTMRMADKVVVLDQGRITAIGTHETLLHESELYAKIYERQAEEQAIEAFGG